MLAEFALRKSVAKKSQSSSAYMLQVHTRRAQPRMHMQMLDNLEQLLRCTRSLCCCLLLVVGQDAQGEGLVER